MKKPATLALFLCIVCFVSYAQKDDPQADYDWSQYDFSAHYTLKNGGGKKIFAENKRIFVGNFQINQVVVANGKATGVSNLAKMTISMTPIEVKAYQALVDKLYKQFVDQLVAEGYTMVSDEEVANSEFAKNTHNGKTVFAVYTKEPYFGKDGVGNEVANFWPTNKFMVANYGAVPGTWPSKFGKAINANVVSLILTINPVSFDGSRRSGYKGGASIEAQANMTVTPLPLATNERGGFAVWGSAVDGKANWVGPKGLFKTDNSVDVFGSVRGTYVLDVNQETYLSEVEAVAGGVASGFIKAIMKETK